MRHEPTRNARLCAANEVSLGFERKVKTRISLVGHFPNPQVSHSNLQSRSIEQRNGSIYKVLLVDLTEKKLQVTLSDTKHEHFYLCSH